MGHYDLPIHEHPLKEKVRAKANHYLTGRDGGREIDLRRFALGGMKLYGRLQDVREGALRFAADLRQNLDRADAVCENIKATIDQYIAREGIDAPVEPPYRPVWTPAEEPSTLDLAASKIRTVIWCNGFRADFRWVEIPVFDGQGYPGHRRGVTPVPGLYFLGLPGSTRGDRDGSAASVPMRGISPDRSRRDTTPPRERNGPASRSWPQERPTEGWRRPEAGRERASLSPARSDGAPKRGPGF